MMKKILFTLFVILFIAGCADKKRVLNIENRSLCSAPSATLYLNTLEIQNSAKTFNISPDEIRKALADSLKETNCFYVFNKKAEPLKSENEYLVETKVSLFQEQEIIEKNIFKKEEKERLSMTIALYAHNESKKINVNTTSELFIDKTKILGFTTQKDSAEDSETVLKNAVKQVSILLKDGFEKLQNSEK